MRRLASAALRWLLFTVLFGTGFTALVVLVGDSGSLTTAALFLWKAGAVGIIALCLWAGRHLYRRGLFPGLITRELDRAFKERA